MAAIALAALAAALGHVGKGNQKVSGEFTTEPQESERLRPRLNSEGQPNRKSEDEPIGTNGALLRCICAPALPELRTYAI